MKIHRDRSSDADRAAKDSPPLRGRPGMAAGGVERLDRAARPARRPSPSQPPSPADPDHLRYQVRALGELAANRGCKLVSSRIRTPGRGDHGRFGLKDAKTGREVFGFGGKGLTALPEEIEAFLRGDAAATWKSSVGKTRRAAPKPVPAPKPRPEPKLVLREARPRDAEAIAALIASLGYEVGAADVRKRLASLVRSGQQALIADKAGIVGVLTTSMMTVLHRPKPVGRISMLVVAEDARGGGIGGALVAEAEKRLAARGCGLIEVTSNRQRLRAHAFYEKLGYERTSYRFAKVL